jgi:hypothetical protein
MANRAFAARPDTDFSLTAPVYLAQMCIWQELCIWMTGSASCRSNAKAG